MSASWDHQIDLGRYDDSDQLVYDTVYANKLKVERSEFYQAKQSGLKPVYVFEVHTFEFDAATYQRVRYPTGSAGKPYNILRTYDKDNELTELVLS